MRVIQQGPVGCARPGAAGTGVAPITHVKSRLARPRCRDAQRVVSEGPGTATLLCRVPCPVFSALHRMGAGCRWEGTGAGPSLGKEARTGLRGSLPPGEGVAVKGDQLPWGLDSPAPQRGFGARRARCWGSGGDRGLLLFLQGPPKARASWGDRSNSRAGA